MLAERKLPVAKKRNLRAACSWCNCFTVLFVSASSFLPFRLYKSLGAYDVLRGVFSSHVGTKIPTRKALLAEERRDYLEALQLYKEVGGALLHRQFRKGAGLF